MRTYLVIALLGVAFAVFPVGAVWYGLKKGYWRWALAPIRGVFVGPGPSVAADPGPNSVAWGWLCGQYNPKLRVLEPSRPHSVQTVAELTTRCGIL